MENVNKSDIFDISARSGNLRKTRLPPPPSHSNEDGFLTKLEK